MLSVATETLRSTRLLRQAYKINERSKERRCRQSKAERKMAVKLTAIFEFLR